MMTASRPSKVRWRIGVTHPPFVAQNCLQIRLYQTRGCFTNDFNISIFFLSGPSPSKPGIGGKCVFATICQRYCLNLLAFLDFALSLLAVLSPHASFARTHACPLALLP